MPRPETNLLNILDGAAPGRRLSWGAILAGAVVTLAIQFVLSLFATYAGLDRLNGGPVAGLPEIDATAAMAVPALMLGIAGLCGGWIASRLAYIPGGMAGAIHGAVAWASAMLVAAVAVTGTLGAVAPGAFSVLSQARPEAMSAVPAMTEALPELAVLAGRERAADPLSAGIEEALQRARDFLLDETDTDREQAFERLLDRLDRLLRAERPLESPEAEAVVELIRRLEGGSPEEAQARLRQWVETYEEAVAEARRQAEEEIARTALAALIAGTALVAGGLAAIIGGWLGAPSRRAFEPE